VKCPHGGASIERCSCCSFCWEDKDESITCRMFPDVCCLCGGKLARKDRGRTYYTIVCKKCGDVKQPELRLREDRPGKIGKD